MCVCVCEREREREREDHSYAVTKLLSLLLCRHDVGHLPEPPVHGGDHEAGVLHPRGRAGPGERRQGPARRVSTQRITIVVLFIASTQRAV